MIFCIHECEEKIGYTFKDKTLLRTCFTHKSYSNEQKVESYEKLEYLGDAILDFIVAEYHFRNVKGDEGDLTKMRADMVSEKPLCEATKNMGIEQFILLGEGEKNNPIKSRVCSNLFESVLAGIYLDGGLENAKKFVFDKLIRPKTKLAHNVVVDNKSILQEYAQKHKLGKIEYVDISKTGPDHAPTYTVALRIKGKEVSRGVAENKRRAHQIAAKTALNKLTIGSKKR